MLESRDDELSSRQENDTHPRSSSRPSLEAMNQYLREIQAIPLLTPAAERQLGKRILAGDSRAVDELVRHNLRFVVMVARRYARLEASLEDLVNEGNLGLIRAAERFDYRRGFRFVSYAVWWIRQAILAYLSEKTRTVRLPIGKAQLLSRLTQTSDRLAQQLGHEPTPAEIGRRMHLPAEKI